MLAPAIQAAAAAQDPCKWIKVEIPKFDGEEAEAWIIAFESYCEIRDNTDILVTIMTGKATLWWYHPGKGITTWGEAKETSHHICATLMIVENSTGSARVRERSNL